MPPKRPLPPAVQTLCDNVIRHCTMSCFKDDLNLFVGYNQHKKDVGKNLCSRVCRSIFDQPGNIKDKAAAAVDIQNLINHFDPSLTFDTSPRPFEVKPDSVETVVAKLDATVTSQSTVLAGLLTTLTALSAAMAASSAGSSAASTSSSAAAGPVATGSSAAAGSTTVAGPVSTVSSAVAASTAVAGSGSTAAAGPVSTGSSAVAGPVSTGSSAASTVSTPVAGPVSTGSSATSGKKRGAPRGPRVPSKRAASGSASAGPSSSASAAAGSSGSASAAAGSSGSASAGPGPSSSAPPARSRSASPTASTRSPSPAHASPKAKTVRFEPTTPIASATPESDAMYWRNVNPVDEESSFKSMYNLREHYWKLSTSLNGWDASNPALKYCDAVYSDYEKLERWIDNSLASDSASNKKKNNICIAHILARYGNALNNMSDDERSAVPVPWMFQSGENLEKIRDFNPDTHVFS